MADQTVNFADLMESGSSERVAFDLYHRLSKHFEASDGDNLSSVANRHLSLYVECLSAVRGGKFDVSRFA